VVKPFWPRAKLNKKANMCTMLPTTSLDGSAVSPLNNSHNDVCVLHEEGWFNSPQNGKTQALTNVKDVQKASNCAKKIKLLEHQIKAAPVNVLDPKPRHSNHMRKVIVKAANISSGNKLETNDDIPVPVRQGSSSGRHSTIPDIVSALLGTFQGNFQVTLFYIAELCIPKSKITEHRCESRD
jgi:hypothetical protein